MKKEQIVEYLINIGRLEADRQNINKLISETAASLNRKPKIPWLGLTISIIFLFASFAVIFSEIHAYLSELLYDIIATTAIIAVILSISAFIELLHIYDTRTRKYKRQQAWLILLRQKLQNTADELSNEYAKNILPPKYRSLTAVAWIYHYIKSDRCENIDEACKIYDHEYSSNYAERK